MPTYRFFKLLNGRVCRPAEKIDCDNDDAAASKARDLVRQDGMDIEIWEGARRVTLVKGRDAT